MTPLRPQYLTTPDGTRIAYRDHAPATPPASPSGSPPATPPASPPTRPFLLLHGLAGHQGEWDDLTARLLADGHRVVTYDARGHGASTRRPPTVTREACVEDAVALIEHLALPAVTLVGQSLGGHTALLVAAARPDLVGALVLVEAGPERVAADTPARIGAWLDSWPKPFASFDEARDFLGHEAWARGLEERADGWWPRVDRDVMVAMISHPTSRDHWPEWRRTTAPALVVRGENGWLPDPEFAAMARPGTERRTIPAAGHDVHLDQPARLHTEIRNFVEASEGNTPGTDPADTQNLT
ncbi:alpha/beta hydrolase [Streptomyces sp. CC219B]|uniref:alpha/beta fold hydrolase n=1 Tax=Streptomyces sp. CC219B TaxID=3044574 RepID=UPI0024A95870|nr:alpha/beta hydrolase [Streptomyces sp. CC219B]